MSDDQDEKLDRIELKIDKVSDHIAEINVTLAKQEEQLSYHIKRTNLLEEKLDPVENHVAMISGAFKLITLLAALISIIVGVAKIAKLI